VRDHIHGHLGEPLSLCGLAAVAGLSPRYFAVAFRRSTGVTPHQFVLQQRVAEARRRLTQRDASIAEVAAELGFASQSHFTDVFRRMVGTTPTGYRKAH
jgi:AraC family transcriptional regulator